MREKISKIPSSVYSAVMASCPIDADNAFVCSAQIQGGVTSKLILYNREDWIAGTITEDADGTITAYANDTALKGYSFDVSDESNLTVLASLRAVDGGADGYDHSITSKAFDISESGAAIISKMRFQKIVAVVERLDGTAKVYGRNVGMRLSDLQFNEGSSDTGGVISYTLKTPDTGNPEIALPTVIDSGTVAGTAAILTAMLVAGT